MNLLEHIRSLGGDVQVENDTITLRVPRGTLTPEIRGAFRRNKQLLRLVLTGRKPSLTEYRAILSSETTLTGLDLPPVPPYRFGEPQHAPAWSAWWDAVEKQRRIRSSP